MPVVYRMADIFVLPSVYNETWGLAVNESMACTRPAIVSSKVGCAQDLVEHGVTGWTFDPGAAAEQKVAGILEQCYANRQDLRSVGVNAEKKVQLYSYDAVARGITLALEISNKRHQGIPS
jgi:glycosyltransferase involved in cell wall biosynthesis